jgi:hypothetical protein
MGRLLARLAGVAFGSEGCAGACCFDEFWVFKRGGDADSADFEWAGGACGDANQACRKDQCKTGEDIASSPDKHGGKEGRCARCHDSVEVETSTIPKALLN